MHSSGPKAKVIGVRVLGLEFRLQVYRGFRIRVLSGLDLGFRIGV